MNCFKKRLAVVAAFVLVGCSTEREAEAVGSVSRRGSSLVSGFTGPLSTSGYGVLALQSDGSVLYSGWANTALWNPSTNLWTAKLAPPLLSSSTARAALTNGKVMRAGGGAPAASTAQLYDPATNTWQQSTLNEARNGAAVTALPAGAALVTGGIGGQSTERYDVSTNTWSRLPTDQLHSRDQSTLLRDGRVLFYDSRATLYDPVADLSWVVDPSTLSAQGAVQLADGKVLFVSATNWFLLDLDALAWVATGSTPSNRSEFVLVALSDGRVMRLGGTIANQSTTSTELFDPQTRSWSGGSPLLQARSTFSAVALGPGFVLVAGGQAVVNGSPQPLEINRSAEIVAVGCVAMTCAGEQLSCGAVSDGCGGSLDCGTCPSGVCSKGQCVACVAATCATLGANCGALPDGCGATLNCGSCSSTQTCVANHCGTTPGPARLSAWNSTLSTPACTVAGRSCDTGNQVVSRATLGAWEPAFPNTLDSTCPDGTSGFFHASPSLDRVLVRSTSGLWLGDGPVVLEATVWVTSLSERLDVFILSGNTWNWVATVAPTALGQQVLTTSFTLPSLMGTFVRTQFRASPSPVPCAPGPTDDRDDLWFQVQLPDTSQPSVYFTEPTMGSTVRGVVAVSAIATDGFAPTTQVFDGQTLLFTSSSFFASGTWNTLVASQGVHNLYARSADLAGNVRTTLNLLVNVDNSPLVSVSAPTASATLTGASTLTASATAVTGRTINTVEFFVDGTSVGSALTSPWSVSWNSRLVANGAHLVTARATDSAGLAATSSAVNVTVSNDWDPPLVSFNTPAPNSTLRGNVLVDAVVSDASALVSAELFDGTTLLGTLAAAPWTFTWNTGAAAQGAHQLRLVATDEHGNTGQTFLGVSVDNAPVVAVTTPTAAQVVVQNVAFDAQVDLVALRSLASVTWLVDGQPVGSVSAPPLLLTWDSRSVGNGAHSVVARAVDSMGLSGDSPPISFVTSNDFDPPLLTLTSPPAGLIRGVVQVEGSATDATALSSTRVAIDGVTLAGGLASPFSVSWNTATANDGPHVVRLEASDSFANSAFVERSVTVDNTLPVVALTAPVAGLVGGLVVLTATASDANGLANVAFFANGVLVGVDATSPYSVAWNATSSSGACSLTAVATDTTGNVATSAPVVVTVATSQTATYSSTFRAPRCGTASTACSTGLLINGRGTVGPETNRPNTLSATCTDGSSGTFHGSGESIDRLEVFSVSGGPLVPGATVRAVATIWATQSTNRVDFYSAANANSPAWVLRGTASPVSLNGATTVSVTFVLPSGGTQAVRAAMRRGGSAATCPSGNFNDRDDVVFVTN